MTLTVEDGTGRPDAQSYVSAADADTYHLQRGNAAWASQTVPSDQKDAALVRATAFLDARYRARFPGYRARARAQALEWPRSGAYTYVPDDGRSDGFLYSPQAAYGWDPGYSYLPADKVPREIIAATCEAALRELVKPGSLAPDLKEGGAIRSVSAGSVNVQFAGAGYSGAQVFQQIELALVSLLMPANPYGGRAVRG